MTHTDHLPTAVCAAIEAGRAIMEIYLDPGADLGIETKQDTSPLTRADKASHQIIIKHLSATPFPVLSEEGRNVTFAERSAWNRLWIVDPLDGTKEFIGRNGEFTVNIALVEDGAPVMGVVYVPVRRELFYGSGAGAYKVCGVDYKERPVFTEIAKRAVRLPLAQKHDGVVAVASRSHLSPETAEFIEKLREKGNLTTVSVGSSLKICSVAEGAADVYPRFGPTMEWDTAAGDAIARAAGCTMRRADSTGPLVYNKENLLNPWFLCAVETFRL